MEAPTRIEKKIELIIRKFLWQGGKTETKGFSLVSWYHVALPYEKGGISIMHPGLMNSTLGGKLIWTLITGEALW